MRIDAGLAAAYDRLEGVSDTPQLDAQLLLCHLLQKPRSFLYTWPDKTLTDAQWRQFEALLQRRSTGEPVAHLIGVREFWSLPLAVNPSTLIPRPDTESLVEYVLSLPLADEAKVVDLGTGTGAIALALASERPKWQLHAVDRMADAVALARHNRDALGLTVEIAQSNWYDALQGQQFDVIVSNPPYIEPDDPHLSQGDVRFEPLSALVAAEDGLADIIHIVENGRLFLNDGGTVILEHGYRQGQAVREIFTRFGYQEVGTGQDLAGRDRYSFGRWNAA
ncbi:peptide chain release factor N(5)-glutamine methyltransferase [Ferrimonas sp. SCSIO 43195]|uniref:peptide chain release factor N(5)-glutamine methyltransferase n=1 Tax=Ferrimonas sp. SCSIO 43195 TaxID=2822844 RepID=UPI002074C503|nr:peptide chain release factor N(5)-glutamine methyltransferase [Ferrimonas sp. SCSIO 43195]USD38261.1 peptide chain release factor N(5)-glutamine methyltransferase [Ferrimonas sp. SCSIO 43195]